MITAESRKRNTRTVPSDVRLAASGDEAAFARLVKGCEGLLYRVCRAILASEADCADAMQDTVITAWRSISQLRDAERFPGWLARICANRCYRIARKSRMPEPFSEPAAPGRDEASRLDVMGAVNGLPQSLRLPVVFFYFEDWSVEETARAMGIFPGTVKSRLHKARSLLANTLSNYKEGYRNDAR